MGWEYIFFYRDPQLFQYYSLKDSFSHLIALASCQKSNGHASVHDFWNLYVPLAYFLVLCQHQPTVLIAVAFENVLKSKSISFPSLFFPKTALDILGPWSFHTNLRINLSIPIKKPTWIQKEKYSANFFIFYFLYNDHYSLPMLLTSTYTKFYTSHHIFLSLINENDF